MDFKTAYLNLYSAVVEALNAWEDGKINSRDVCLELKELIDRNLENEEN